MISVNTVILGGNLTRDPEVKYTASGTAVGKLGLAVNEKYKTSNGEQKEDVLFVDVEVWARQAETCQEYLKKGSQVLIEGSLKLDQWDDKETGKKRSRHKIRARRVTFIGSRKENNDDQGDDSPPF